MSRGRDDLPGNYLQTKKPQQPQPRASREVRRTSTPARRRNRPTAQSRRISAVVGGILLFAAVAWIAWLVSHQSQQSGLSIPGLAPMPTAQVSSLAAAGITLGQPSQPPALSQQQALLIASQLEPDAASNAQSTSTQYVLLNYTSKSTTAAHSDLHNVPAWMVLYQNIPLAHSDTSADPTPAPPAHHDLYVFLDTTTGKELLALSV